MRKNKDQEWACGDQNSNSIDPVHVTHNLLMDIRDELQDLNRLLQCPNFTSIPVSLRAIRRNTAQPKRKVKR